jgi:hypothetical protein
VAQSSLDASLTSIVIGALCGAEFTGGLIEPPLLPPPQAVRTAPARLTASNRDVFETMTRFSSNLTIINSCRVRTHDSRRYCKQQRRMKDRVDSDGAMGGFV